jgi:hypothetical protein
MPKSLVLLHLGILRVIDKGYIFTTSLSLLEFLLFLYSDFIQSPFSPQHEYTHLQLTTKLLYYSQAVSG